MNLIENLNNSFNYAKKLLSDGGRLIILIILISDTHSQLDLSLGYACKCS